MSLANLRLARDLRLAQDVYVHGRALAYSKLDLPPPFNNEVVRSRQCPMQPALTAGGQARPISPLVPIEHSESNSETLTHETP